MPTPPQQLAVQIARMFPDALFYKETTAKVVALTIDDVPTPDEVDDASTQLILDAIATHNRNLTLSEQARATFFMISSHIREESGIIDRIVEQGHEIGNHGTVDEMSALLHPEVFAQQLDAAHDRIVKQYPQSLRWYRPGHGLYNKKMLHYLQQKAGYEPRFALESMLPMDTFKPTNDCLFTAWYVSQHIFPGAILVLHGGSPQRSSQTARALTLILATLRERCYRTVTLSELWDME